MKKQTVTTAERLKARYPRIISGELPSLSNQAKASFLDYAASVSNQASCYTGHQYIENFHYIRPFSKEDAQAFSLYIQMARNDIKRLAEQAVYMRRILKQEIQNWKFLTSRLSVDISSCQ